MAGDAEWPLPPPSVVRDALKHCRCCSECSDPPCHGSMVTGFCDRARCSCDDDYEPEDRDDDEF